MESSVARARLGYSTCEYDGISNASPTDDDSKDTDECENPSEPPKIKYTAQFDEQEILDLGPPLGPPRHLSNPMASPATPSTSTRQKSSNVSPLTISEDRSRGSDFDVKNRMLTAIRSQSSTQKNIKPVLEETPRTRRVMEAGHPTNQMGLESLDEMSDNESFPVQGNDPEPNLHHVHEDPSLNDALHIIRRKLNIQDESLLTIESLREYASKAKMIEPRVQLIHRVSQDKDKKMYLDAPRWLAGANSSQGALVGDLAVRRASSYLSKHPEVICIVYRDYDGSHPGVEHFYDDNLDADKKPKHNSEVIEPESESLKVAVLAFWNYFNFGVDPAVSTRATLLSSPYLPVFHTRGIDLDSFCETLDNTKRQHFCVFLNYIFTEYRREYELVGDMISRGKITHEYIKYLFKPGDVIVEGNHQDSRGYLSTSWLGDDSSPQDSPGTESPQKSGPDLRTYYIEVQCWNFDGVFSRQKSSSTLKVNTKDTSEKIIQDLDIRPLAHVNDSVKERLRRRGEWFWKFRVRNLVSYQVEKEPGLRDYGHGRYMIDMKMFHELHPQEKTSSLCEERDDLGPKNLEQNDPPDDKFVYLTPPNIKGFNLKKKKWLDLDVDKIRPVIWNKQAFKHLVIKEKTKRLIQALISNQIEAERSTDLITGKGNGLIMLLHGGPGTGKTLTAESVAEIAERPLYPVTCGDIGTKPEEVEEYLESVLHIGKTWGCVVLLDEADVFLEQRSLEDLHRNALVSVFLRVLEYYDGILVLTSNRVGTFDEAFKSRIQLALHYKNLTEYQRTQIWRNFLSRLEEMNEEGIDFADLEDSIEKLAKHKLNGREIRNVITTARQYARWERQQPNQQHIQLNCKMMNEVIETAGEFDRYIEKLNGGNTYDQLAEDDGLR